MDKKQKARSLYEKEGISLSTIARYLDININTINTWKRRENWKAKTLSQTNGHNPKSLSNLHKYPNFKKGNKVAFKHGLYSDNSNQPGYYDYYDQALYEPIERVCRELMAHIYACIRISDSYLDYSDINELVVSTEASYYFTVMLLRVANLKNSVMDKALDFLEQEFVEDLNLTARESFAKEYANLMVSHVNLKDVKQVATMVKIALRLMGKALRLTRKGLLKEIDIYYCLAA